MAMAEPDIEPANRERYTFDGDETVEARIARDQSRVVAAVTSVVGPPTLCAVVLMGGYGRGEGGYLFRDGQPGPYNDYDYFVVVKGLNRAARKALNTALAQQAKGLEPEVGVEVDFALLREEKLSGAEYSLMNAEMLWGHRVVTGDPKVLDAMPAMPFSQLPAGEFSRLLLNRGSLLLMNQRQLQTGKPLNAQDQEIFFKYLFKAVLACGDVRLSGNRCYHPSYARKIEILRGIDWPGKDPFMELYVQAWDHKFHPHYERFASEDPAAWQQQVVRIWLDTLAWFEQVRTGNRAENWNAYCSPSFAKGQGGKSWWGLRNAAINLRHFGPMELLRRPRWSLRYPRERLISVLPLLLSAPSEQAGRRLAEALAIPVGTPWTEALQAYFNMWRCYS
jgi:hypothetical protein